MRVWHIQRNGNRVVAKAGFLAAGPGPEKKVDGAGRAGVGSGSFSPNRRAGLEVLASVRSEPRASWSLPALFGLAVERYEKRFGRRWKPTASYTQKVYTNLSILANRVGAEEAANAIEAVFGMKWVNSDHFEFVLNKDNYSRFVVPAMSEKMESPSVGEQAEWRGVRPSETRSVSLGRSA